MKATIAILALAVSANVMAYSITDSTVLTSATPLLSSATTSGELQKAQAAAIINDSQEYFQSGKLSAFLAQKVAEVQAQSELSIDEAVDALVDDASNI